MSGATKRASEWGGKLPSALGDAAMQLHERVLWRCVQDVCNAVGNEPWLALIGGTALRHTTWLRRASLDLDFLVIGPGWQVGAWVKHALDRTAGVERGSVETVREDRLQTTLRYTSDETGTTQVLRVDKLDARPRKVNLRTEPIEYDGVRTLHPEKLAELKLETLVGTEPRMKTRDIYDATHLMRRYRCALTREQLATLDRICNTLFEREEQWIELFDDDEVLSTDVFDTVRGAFTKTTNWRKRALDSGEEFKPVEGRGPRYTFTADGSTVQLVDNRPTYEGETIGVAHGPEEAAAMLIEAEVAEAGEKEELIATIARKMEGARALATEAAPGADRPEPEPRRPPIKVPRPAPKPEPKPGGGPKHSGGRERT